MVDYQIEMKKQMKIKVCGMKYRSNIEEILSLDIDFMGFIFHKMSSRYIDKLPEGIDFGNVKKVGVFVNSSEREILLKIEEFGLDFLQLHGGESVGFCSNLKEKGHKIIKVFSVDDNFDFAKCKEYLDVSDMFLFDAKGVNPGGNGVIFNWQKLDEYNLQKPFLLSGGIGINHVSAVKNFYHPGCIGIDVNSGFEDSPGKKNDKLLKRFLEEINK